MPNILLTGNKQVGKSTIINKIIEDYPGGVCGFKTVMKQTPRRQFFISEFQKSAAIIANSVERTRSYPLPPISSTFDNEGATILKRCFIQSPELIIMDELGLFENRAFYFQKLVHKGLNSDIPILGVLKDKPSRFLNSIRDREDVEIIRVSEENRNQLVKIVMSKLLTD
ncbi:nucleoside-triphosphatase [Robertmurraya siralis]|uniref:nucleoside-triphosphatase n=1 Tax=Robertmurraya siralis TaxID=77777 RepID=UPI0010F5ECB9|nr:nucleoside-triphosphatase [Robertmurraya siralis]